MKGLSETGYLEGQNAVVECHWLSGQNDHLDNVSHNLSLRQAR